MGEFIVGLIIGMLIIVAAAEMTLPTTTVKDCTEYGYFVVDDKIIKCQVIDKNQLIKRNLGEQL